MLTTDQIKVGVVGAGAFGRVHMSAYHRAGGAVLTAVADNDEARARTAAEAYGAPVVFTEVIDLLDSGLVEAISVVTPGATHVEIASEAARRGIAVLLEKPVALTHDDAKRLLSAASDAVVVPAHVLRFAAPYIALRERARAGVFGSILGVRAERHRTVDHRALYGDVGIPLMTTIHDLDMAIWLTGGAPHTVRAVSPGLGPNPPDTVLSATADLSDGSFWSFCNSWILSRDQEDLRDSFLVLGTEGAGGVTLGDDATGVLSDAMDNQIHHFLTCVARGEQSDVVPIADAIAGIAVAEAITRSARLNEAIDLGGRLLS